MPVYPIETESPITKQLFLGSDDDDDDDDDGEDGSNLGPGKQQNASSR
jgi:hypothetical protein